MEPIIDLYWQPIELIMEPIVDLDWQPIEPIMAPIIDLSWQPIELIMESIIDLRLANTLRLVAGVHWLVAEDRKAKSYRQPVQFIWHFFLILKKGKIFVKYYFFMAIPP